MNNATFNTVTFNGVAQRGAPGAMSTNTRYWGAVIGLIMIIKVQLLDLIAKI